MDIGSADRLAFQNLQIPGHSTNRTHPKFNFPHRFPDKQRLTSSRPDAILAEETLPTSFTEKEAHPSWPAEPRVSSYTKQEQQGLVDTWRVAGSTRLQNLVVRSVLVLIARQVVNNLWEYFTECAWSFCASLLARWWWTSEA
eukprot:1146255-Pelagomonas_calceolata.AAC.1